MQDESLLEAGSSLQLEPLWDGIGELQDKGVWHGEHWVGGVFIKD